MNGREENKQIIEEKLRILVSKYPFYVNAYYLSLSGKQAKTKFDYVYIITKFLNDMKERGIDIDDASNLNYENTADYIDRQQYKVKNGVKVEVSASAKKTTWYALNSFFKFMTKRKLVSDNPMESIDCTKEKDNVKHVYMTTEDLGDIVGKLNKEIEDNPTAWFPVRNLAMLVILMETGIRVTALSEINVEDVSFEENCATIRIIDKEKHYFDKIVSNQAAEYILNWMRVRKEIGITSDALFVNQYKVKRMSSSAIEDVVKKYTPIIEGRYMTAHRFRATYARTLYNETHDIYFVQTQMGHKSPETTAIYVGQDVAQVRKATSIMSGMIYGRG